MKPYTAPHLIEYDDVPAATADSRDNDDTFFSLNGPEPGLGGSFDTEDDIR